MFEFSVACKYLLPRWRQLSVSIISMISILVIAVVVWLIVVFFSITMGLEKTWVHKLVALTAPIRITPTEAYYNSYYYQVDHISSGSNFAAKTIGEKLLADLSDPYDPNRDEEMPAHWPEPKINAKGELQDIVKEAFQSINALQGYSGLAANDYEMTFSNLRLQLLRNQAKENNSPLFLSQAAYLGSIDNENPALKKTLLPMTMPDITNLLNLLSITTDGVQEDTPSHAARLPKEVFQGRLKSFLDNANITYLKTPPIGWAIPRSLLQDIKTPSKLKVWAVVNQDKVSRVYIPSVTDHLNKLEKVLQTEGYEIKQGTLSIPDLKLALNDSKEIGLSPRVPLILESNFQIPAQLEVTAVKNAKQAEDLKFNLHFNLQGIIVKGTAPYAGLEIGQADIKKNYTKTNEQSPPSWVYQEEANGQKTRTTLPTEAGIGDAALLPRTFKEAGVLIGDRGYLSYFTPTTSSIQEQRVPIYVAGFYDPGIIPIGGKYVLVNKDITTLIRSTYNQEDRTLSNGINIRFDDISKADEIKAALQKEFANRGIDAYWKIETFREYDFSRELLQQIQSEKHVFTLIAIVIILVACSNIISMLIILVNDKKKEIGILISMGATSRSIAAIFGICGMVIGLLGSLIGTLAAVFTLHNLNALLDLISRVQGYKAFSAHFYGESLPNELSYQALGFVLIVTALISLLAGLVPALKASWLRPSEILRAE